MKSMVKIEEKSSKVKPEVEILFWIYLILFIFIL